MDNYDRMMDRKPVEEDPGEANFVAGLMAQRHRRVEELLANQSPPSHLGPDGKLDPDLLTYDRRCYSMWLQVVAEHALLQQMIGALSYTVLYVHAKLETDTDSSEEAQFVADKMLQCTQEPFDGNLETWLDEATDKIKPHRWN